MHDKGDPPPAAVVWASDSTLGLNSENSESGWSGGQALPFGNTGTEKQGEGEEWPGWWWVQAGDVEKNANLTKHAYQWSRSNMYQQVELQVSVHVNPLDLRLRGQESLSASSTLSQQSSVSRAPWEDA